MNSDVAAGSLPAAVRGLFGPGFARDSVALAASSVITGLLGLVFWAAAARHYSVSEVGRGSAVISSATMISALANLSLGGMYERFLPVAGHRARRLVAAGTSLAFTVALVLGTGFVLLLPTSQILTTPTEMIAFPIFVAVLSAFSLQDNLLTGFRAAHWAAAKNVFHAAAKLALVVLLGVTASGFSIAVAWIVPAAIAGTVAVVWIFRRALGDETYSRDPDLPPHRELAQFFGSTYGLTVVASLAPLLIPLIVVNQLGTESNGYFTMAWTLVTAVAMLMSVVVGPFIAEAAGRPEELPALTRRFIGLLTVVGLSGAAFLLLGAPLLLSFFGKDYGTEGAALVRVMAATMALSILPTLYGALARVRRRLALAVVMQIVSSVLLVAGSFLLAAPFGLVGVGYAYLGAEIVACALIAVPTVRILRAQDR